MPLETEGLRDRNNSDTGVEQLKWDCQKAHNNRKAAKGIQKDEKWKQNKNLKYEELVPFLYTLV